LEHSFAEEDPAGSKMPLAQAPNRVPTICSRLKRAMLGRLHSAQDARHFRKIVSANVLAFLSDMRHRHDRPSSSQKYSLLLL
jgi:hypothetical protein